MSKRRTRREAMEAALREPETLDIICDFIASGGTLRRWCERWVCEGIAGFRYHRLHEWLHDDTDRLKKYAKALEARNAALGDVVVDGMREGAEADVRQLYDDKGNTIAPHQLPDSMARVVNKVKVTRKVLMAGKGEDAEPIGEEVTTEYGLDSRVASREQLGKHLGMFKDNVSVDGKLKIDDVAPEETARRIAFALAAALKTNKAQRASK